LHRQSSLTSNQERYLRAILLVRDKHKIARVRDVAKRLAVTSGTVSSTIRKLERAGFVEHEQYGGVVLSQTGSAVARCTLRRCDTIRDVLIEVFGVDADRAAEDACLMEHAVSPATVNPNPTIIREREGARVRQAWPHVAFSKRSIPHRM
jgi:DtxR family Mn-dependent transcriptional regulator